jgi:hypothetical protein
MGEGPETARDPERAADAESGQTSETRLSLPERMRRTDIGRTVRRRVDVKGAFGSEEQPTAPAARRECSLAFCAEEYEEGVDLSIPLDTLPELAVADTEVPWTDLGSLATELLLRVDGSRSTMSIVTGLSEPPIDGVRALAQLVSRGIVRLLPLPSEAPPDEPLPET